MSTRFAGKDCGLAVSVVAFGTALITWAQEAPQPPVPESGSTVLDVAFAGKLEGAWVHWPTSAELTAAGGAPTEHARRQVLKWLVELLEPGFRPFDSTPEMTDGHFDLKKPLEQTPAWAFRNLLTPAVIAGGKDVLCCRWRAGEYRFQLEMTNTGGWLSIAPCLPGGPRALGPDDTAVRIDRLLREVLNGGEKSLRMGHLKTTSQPHGFTMAFQPDDEAAWRRALQVERYEAPLWMKHMQIRTDGQSVALFFPTWVFDAVPTRPRGRWFAPLPSTVESVPASSDTATSAPAPNTEAQQEAMRRLIELRERMIREEEHRKQK